MSLAAGARLGPYEIIAPLGAGGMGEVYRAKDTRLGREVAVKVLPRIFAHDEQFLARFEREARSISALNHPHICTLHDVGRHDDAPFLVMELLDGESLADRLEKGPLPVDQVLRYGAEIARALHHAHRQGIIHRDLKPGNVMLTKSGAKLLDFGLARAASGEAAPVQGMTALPTQAQPLTAQGAILGTFQYMAPEQLEGQEADARTDIFALGALLYEMATGRKAFEGKNRTSLIAAIVSSQPPPISTIQPVTPAALENVVRKCLEKDPDERWHSAHDVAGQLKWIAESTSPSITGPPVETAPRRKRRAGAAMAWTVAGLFAALALALGVAFFLRQPPPRPVLTASIALPEGLHLRYEGIQPGPPALSPDGTRLALVLVSPRGTARIFLRELSDAQLKELEGTEDASYPFWSPDSRAIGFFANGKLKTMGVTGGAPLVLAEAPSGKGGTWNAEGIILYAPSFNSTIHRIPATGGESTEVTHLESIQSESSHRFPQFLPDGRHFLFLSRGSTSKANTIWAGSLDGGAPRKVLESETQVAYAAGRLLFSRGGTLMAQRMDPARLEVSGDPVPVVSAVEMLPGASRSLFTVSETGLLVFQPGSASAAASRLVLVDRTGKELRVLAELRASANSPAVSPDGRTVALEDVSGAAEKIAIWTLDLARGARARLTTGEATEVAPRFSPKGDAILFSSSRNGPLTLYSKSIERGGDEQPLLKGREPGIEADWSPDGKHLIFTIRDPKSLEDIWTAPVDGSSGPKAYLSNSFPEFGGRFSPDGRWVSYTSGGGDRYQVMVTSFPDPGRRWQVSIDGGIDAVWRRDGREILFKSLEGQLMAVDFRDTPAGPEIGTPVTLFNHPTFFEFDIMPDGKTMVAVVPQTAGKTIPLTVVSDWTAGLEKR